MSRSITPALATWLDALACPHCGQGLDQVPAGVRCPALHRFDASRSGYLSLLSGARATSGDDDDMARARDRFLATGSYRPIRRAVAKLTQLTPSSMSRVLDIGCGTGYYLTGVLDEHPGAQGLGVDTSARALRFTAQAHPRAAAASWDVFAPFPMVDEAVDVILDVFAPRNPAEFARVLRPGGRLLVVRPAPDHLYELRERVPGMISVDPRKEDRLHASLDPLFTTEEIRPLRFPAALDSSSAADLVAMTPSARHVARDSVDSIAHTVPVTTVSVVVSVHTRR